MKARVRLLLAIAVVAAQALADDLSVPRRELATSPDFRVRMASALALGRSHDLSVRPLLEQALSDPNAAVRTAAAAALGALGDGAAVPALERAKAHEPSASTRAQIDSTIATLNRRTTLEGVQLVVQIGAMRNNTQTRGQDVADVLRNATSFRTRTMQHVAVVQPNDSAMLARAADRHVPVVMLDGTVTRLTQTSRSNVVTCQAEVEFLVRKMPEQSLRSTLSGSAAAMGSGTVSARGVASLQDQAIGGAVESALRDAGDGLLVAAR